LIYQAVEAEFQELLAQYAERRTADGKAGVVRNGYLPERELRTGAGPVAVRTPKVRAKTEDPVTFRSALVPLYVRKTKSLEAALPWLYVKGVSNGEMSEGLAVLVGQDCARSAHCPAAGFYPSRCSVPAGVLGQAATDLGRGPLDTGSIPAAESGDLTYDGVADAKIDK